MGSHQAQHHERKRIDPEAHLQIGSCSALAQVEQHFRGGAPPTARSAPP